MWALYRYTYPAPCRAKLRSYFVDLTEAVFAGARRGPRLAENAKQTPQLVCIAKALYKGTSWQVLRRFCETRFERVWPVLRPRAPNTLQVVCVSSTRVEASCRCFLDFPLRQSDGGSTKTAQREYGTRAPARASHLKRCNLCAFYRHMYPAPCRAKLRSFFVDLTEAVFAGARRGPRLAENAKQTPQLVCTTKALYEGTS